MKTRFTRRRGGAGKDCLLQCPHSVPACLCVRLIFAVFIAIWAPAEAIGQEASRKPNVVFLFADDQRADTIGALGNPNIETPNLDQLVKSGFVFRNAYCLGANVPAVCTPSRNMLLSGRAYFRWQGPQAQPEMPNFPTSMKVAGYETYHHGKRGNTSIKIQELFDHNKYFVDQQD